MTYNVFGGTLSLTQTVNHYNSNNNSSKTGQCLQCCDDDSVIVRVE